MLIGVLNLGQLNPVISSARCFAVSPPGWLAQTRRYGIALVHWSGIFHSIAMTFAQQHPVAFGLGVAATAAYIWGQAADACATPAPHVCISAHEMCPERAPAWPASESPPTQALGVTITYGVIGVVQWPGSERATIVSPALEAMLCVSETAVPVMPTPPLYLGRLNVPGPDRLLVEQGGCLVPTWTAMPVSLAGGVGGSGPG